MPSFDAPVRGEMLPPPTPKRPTLGLKRDSSHLDDETTPARSTSLKKLKVAFDDNVDVRIMDDWTDKSLDLVKEEVSLGIQRHIALEGQQNDTQYAKLLHILGQNPFSDDAPSSRLLEKYIVALDGCVGSLNRCNTLVLAALDVSWLGRGDGFVASYTKFLRVLAGAQTMYLSAIMERLTSYFEKIPASVGRLPGESPISKAIMLDRLHDAIQMLLRRSPSAGSVLIRRLKQQYPNELSTTRSYLQYQRNLIRLANHAPELRDEILALIMQRLVNIDIQIQRDLDELDEGDEDSLLQSGTKANLENAEDSDDSDDESVSDSEITLTEGAQALQDLRLKVAKMDGTQDLLFDYYNESLHLESSPERNPTYRQLLLHFDNFIMPTRSRHAQFLLFHFSQHSTNYAEAFVQHCRTILETNGAVTTRLTACAYLASFIARASHIPADLVRHVVQVLCDFLESMRQRYEPGCFGPDRRSYSLYYAVAQALLYIFCFRWRDLVVRSPSPDISSDMSEDDMLAEGRDLTWLPGIKEILYRNAHSPLNPLKVCSAAIVNEFAKISNHLRFLYVFTLLERNKRIRLGQNYSIHRLGGSGDIGRRETAWDRKRGEAHHQLEAYFPFDPYQLPKSKRWIDGDYNEWVLPPGMKAEDDDDDDDYSGSEDEFESDDEGAVEPSLALSRMASADTLPIST